MLTTVVGNYPKIANRPDGQALRRALARHDQGKATWDDVERVQDEVTGDIIGEQARAGIDLVTDGRIRWDDDTARVARGLEGMQVTGLLRYFDSNTYYRQPLATGPVRWTKSILARDFQFAREASEKPVKVTLPGPYTFARMSRSEHHDGVEALGRELAAALNQEARALEAAGATHIQFDEPWLTWAPEDASLVVSLLGEALAGLTVTTELRTYFGHIVGVEDAVYATGVGVLGLDMIQGARNWDILSSIPRRMHVSLGLVDARNTKMDDVSALARGIEQAAGQLGAERLSVSPSCGLEFLPREVAYAKLQRLVEGARLATEAVAR